MVEEDAAHREQPVALPVVDSDVVAVDLGDPVGRARMERGQLVLRRLPHLPEHLAAGRLVETDGRVDQADRVQHPGDPETGDLPGVDRLLEGEGGEADRPQVVDLVRVGRPRAAISDDWS